MATKGPRERLRAAITAAPEQSARARPAAVSEGASSPGDLFVFGGSTEVGLEWLLVRFHPDDSGLALIAPVDAFPLAGTPDVVLTAETAGRVMTVRCGETDWVPAHSCTPRLRVDTLPEAALSVVRQRLADLARGRAVCGADPSVDFDAEYEDWMAEVARARLDVVAKAERLTDGPAEVISLSSFRPERPSQFVMQFEYPLAAESGASLLTELAAEMAPEAGVAYHEVPGVVGGKLVLVANDRGVRPVWEGPWDAAPTVRGNDASGDELVVTWDPGPEGVLHRGSVVLPWVDGRVVVRFGSDPSRTVAVEL